MCTQLLLPLAPAAVLAMEQQCCLSLLGAARDDLVSGQLSPLVGVGVNSSGCLKLVSRICDLLKYIYLWSFGMGKGGLQEWRGGFRYLSQQGAGSPFTCSRYTDKE